MFLGIVLIGLLGCKKSNEVVPQDLKLNKKTQVITLETNQSDCSKGIIIYMDGSKIDKKWKEDNKSWICDTLPPNNLNITVNILNTTLVPNDQVVADWLKKNSQLIFYKKNYSLIEKIHLKNNPIDIAKITAKIKPTTGTPQFTAFKLDYLKGLITDFDNLFYEKYYKFDFTQNKFKVTVVDSYRSGMKCFSLPFLKSIIEVNNISTSDLQNYTLKVVEFDNNTVAFEISNNNGFTKYYNYSTEPSNPGSTLGLPINFKTAFL